MKRQRVKSLLKRAAAFSLAAAVVVTPVSGMTAVAADGDNSSTIENTITDSTDNDNAEGLSGNGGATDSETNEPGGTTDSGTSEPGSTTDSGASESGGETSGNNEQDTKPAVSIEDVTNQISEAEKAAGDAVASIPFGDVKQEEQKAVSSEETTDTSVENAEKIIEDAEDEINTKEHLNNGNKSGNTEQNTTDANTNMDSAENTMDAAQEAYDAELDAAKNKIEEGFTTSDEAQETLNNLTQAQTDAQNEFNKAQMDLTNAKTNLEAAQAAYDDAKNISDEAAAEAAAELEAAKAEMQKAVDAANTANERVKKVQEMLGDASGYLESWKEDVDSALADVEEKLEESKEELHDAVANLDTESEEVKQAAEDFKEKFDDFTDAAKDFNTSIKDAVEKQKELDELYAKYEALKEARDEAQKAYDELGGDAAKAEVEGQLEGLNKALDDAEKALKAAEDAKAVYETEDAVKYVEELNSKKDVLADGTATEEAKADAAKELAQLVVEKELAGNAEGSRVIWVGPDGNGEYGTSENGFYVVLDENNKVIKRYGYTVDIDDESNANKGTVTIYEMKGENTTNYIEINGQEYEIKVNDDAMSIQVDGKEVIVHKENRDGKDTFFIEENGEVKKGEGSPDITKPTKLGIYTVYYDDPKGPYILLADLLEKGKRYVHYDADEGLWYREGTVVAVPIDAVFKKYEYNKKDVAIFDGNSYDIETSEDGTHYIVKDGEVINIKFTDSGYTYENPVTFVPGGDANTNYVKGGADYSSDTYINNKIQAEETYKANKDTYDEKKGDYDQANEKFTELNNKFQDLVTAEDEFNKGDLNSLAELPRNVTDLVGNVGMEGITDIADLLKKMDEVQNAQGADKIKALTALIKEAGSIGNILPAVEIDEFIINLVYENKPEGIEGILDPNKKWSQSKHDYAVAWMDAVKAKIEVVKKGKDLIDATSATIVSGMELISKGADLGDAVLDTMIAGVKTGILAGAAGTIGFASDVLGVSNQLVEALEGKVSELQIKTQKAYDEALEAQRLLEQLKLENPKVAELAAADTALKEAWARYEELDGELKNAQLSLENAEDYKKAAEDEYNRLREIENRPTENPENPQNPDTTDNGTRGTTNGTTDTTGGATYDGTVDDTGAETPAIVTLLNADVPAANAATLLAETPLVVNAAAPAAGNRTALNNPAGDNEEDIAGTVEDEAEAVTIEDEDTPLAEEPEDNVQQIEDEEVPLANVEVVCHLQWIILLLTIIFGAYNTIRIYNRRKAAQA